MPALERELERPAPRPVHLTTAGRFELTVTLIVSLAGVLVMSTFFSFQPRPLWLDALFMVFALLGAVWVYRIAVVWISRLQLVRNGLPEWGVVVRRELDTANEGKTARYVVWYAVDGEQWSVEGTRDSRVAAVGDAMTVLRLPEAPGQSILYRFARFRAAAPPERAPNAVSGDNHPTIGRAQ